MPRREGICGGSLPLIQLVERPKPLRDRLIGDGVAGALPDDIAAALKRAARLGAGSRSEPGSEFGDNPIGRSAASRRERAAESGWVGDLPGRGRRMELTAP
jgi:hypothetical protein